MALTTPIPAVPDTTTYEGIGVIGQTFVIIPGSSDYVTGGYALSAQAFGLNLIHGAALVASNAAGGLYVVSLVFPSTFFSATPQAATSINFQVATPSAPTITTTTNATTTTPVYTNSGALTQVAGATGITGVQAPVLVQVASGFDLSSCRWAVRVWGN